MPFMCNTCFDQVSSFKKLKFCQFCAQANCGNCLYKTRTFPRNNPQRLNRGHICIQCDKKFLYRDALHENQLKLEIRDKKAEQTRELLAGQEKRYGEMVSELTQVNLLRQQQHTKIKQHLKQLNHLLEVQIEELGKCRIEKDY